MTETVRADALVIGDWIKIYGLVDRVHAVSLNSVRREAVVVTDGGFAEAFRLDHAFTLIERADSQLAQSRAGRSW